MNIKLNYKKWGLIALIVVNVSALSALAVNRFYKPSVISQVTAEHPMINFLEQELNFTDQQISRFSRIKDKFEQNTIELRRQMIEIKSTMFTELSKSNSNPEKLESLSMQFGQLEGRLKRITMDHFLEMKAICNPDQQKTLIQYFERMQHRPGMGKGPMHGRGRGMGRMRPD